MAMHLLWRDCGSGDFRKPGFSKGTGCRQRTRSEEVIPDLMPSREEDDDDLPLFAPGFGYWGDNPLLKPSRQSLVHFRCPARRAPPRSIVPKMINPVEKDLVCPMSPIMAGIAPPPIKKLTGTIKEMVMLLN